MPVMVNGEKVSIFINEIGGKRWFITIVLEWW